MHRALNSAGLGASGLGLAVWCTHTAGGRSKQLFFGGSNDSMVHSTSKTARGRKDAYHSCRKRAIFRTSFQDSILRSLYTMR